MTFKPFKNKYDFTSKALVMDFPDYLRDPIEDWLWSVLKNAYKVGVSDYYLHSGRRYVEMQFLNSLQLDFREVFPQIWDDFFRFVYSDSDRLCNFLAYILQKYADGGEATRLEDILSRGGSGYTVIKTIINAPEYQNGVYDLTDRVDEVTVAQSKQAITENDVLMQAWLYCYSQNPDYAKVVIECQNFLETFLRDRYEPANKKPQIGKLIGNLKTTSEKMRFKGDNVVNNKSVLLDLIDNIAKFRGLHTAGTGKNPNKAEAEYILHTTIYIWNLHKK